MFFLWVHTSVLLTRCYHYCSCLSFPDLLEGPQGQEICLHGFSLCPGTEFAIEHKRKWEGERKEGKEVLNTGWLLLSIYLPLFWLPVREPPFPVLSLGIGVWMTPTPNSGPNWPKNNHGIPISCYTLVQRWCITESETFPESSEEDKPPSSIKDTKDTLVFLTDRRKCVALESSGTHFYFNGKICLRMKQTFRRERPEMGRGKQKTTTKKAHPDCIVWALDQATAESVNPWFSDKKILLSKSISILLLAT